MGHAHVPARFFPPMGYADPLAVLVMPLCMADLHLHEAFMGSSLGSCPTLPNGQGRWHQFCCELRGVWSQSRFGEDALWVRSRQAR